jgi:superfamily II DNA or RNA helicase
MDVVETSEIKRELTVRPVIPNAVVPSPSFKVYRRNAVTGTLLVPRYFGIERFGTPATQKLYSDYVRAPKIVFTGRLRNETRQTDAFEAGVRAFEKGGGVLSLPCGFGKTTVALAFSAHLKVRTMIVVHKEFLANQWVEKINQFCPGASIGRVQGDVFDIEKDFVIAMIQTMCQREFPSGAFDSFGFLVVDEAHHIGAPAFSQFMFKMRTRWTLGLTATPERKDGLTRLLYWFLGPEFFRIERTGQATTRVRTLNYSCDAYKETPPVTRFGKLNMAGMVNVITELEHRTELIVETAREALAEGRRVLVLSDRREHCFEIQNKLGSNSALYVGGMKEKDLEVSARSPIVVATFQLAHEGLDIPALDTVILATPKSDIKQAIGRIMRDGAKGTPLIIDILDHWSVCFSMYAKRKAVYKSMGATFEGKETENCDASVEVFGKGKCLL